MILFVIIYIFSSGSLIHNNYEALVSHVERLTHHDAMTLLRITQSDARRRTGRTPRTQGDYRRAMENMGEVLIVRAIMGSSGIAPTSYEVRPLTGERGGGRERKRERKRERERWTDRGACTTESNIFRLFLCFLVGLA
jgi:hypothetical protein